jgi:tRNA uridine 5-carboxymethylaminomethyl modification enzyme
LIGDGVVASDRAWLAAWAMARYEPYLRRERAEIKRAAAMERRRLPAVASFAEVTGLRAEAAAALERFRPQTLGQAGRLEGVTPADISLLMVHIRRGAIAS